MNLLTDLPRMKAYWELLFPKFCIFVTLII